MKSRLDMSGVYLSILVRFKEHEIKVGHVRSISFDISLGSRSIDSRLDMSGKYFSILVRFKEHEIKVGHFSTIF